jgi:HlyD family secretion protein
VSDLEQAHALVRAAEASVAAAESRVQIASGGLQEAQKNVDWATLRAPIDGTVLAVNHRVGERIRGSDFSEDVVLVLGAVTKMEVRIEIGEHDIVHIKPDQKATVELDAVPDKTIRGHVLDWGRDAIVKNAGTDSEVTTFPVWIALDDPPPEALSGMSAQVSIATESHDDAIAVPIQAVTVRAGGDTPKADTKSETGPQVPSPQPRAGKLDKVVFVVKQDGTVEKRKVTVDLTSETMIQIVNGLDPGETVVDGPYRTLARQLNDGDAVEVEKDDDAKGSAKAN